MPRQLSWIDQRFVRDGHISRCTANALALYLLLCTVADAQGLSYYSDPRAASLLSLSESKLRKARAEVGLASPVSASLRHEPRGSNPKGVALSRLAKR